jgi:hypothetical protein
VCTPIWSGKVCTPIFLEWGAVHSNIFEVNTFPLQIFSLAWSKQSYNQNSLQKFGVQLKPTPKILECTSSPLQIFWTAPQVHSKKFGVHSKSTPTQLEYTTFHSKNVKILECTTAHSNFFWSGWLFTPFFLEWTLVPTPKCWSPCSKSLECI